jgi:hypothetical protein
MILIKRLNKINLLRVMITPKEREMPYLLWHPGHGTKDANPIAR